MKRNGQLEIVERVVEKLSELEKPMNFSQFSGKCDLHLDTMKRALEIIECSKNAPNFKIMKVGKVGIIYAIEEHEILEHIKERVLREFPKLNEEDIILIKMFNKNVTTPESAIEIENKKIAKELEESFKIERINGKYFLTDIGSKIARSLSRLNSEGRIL